MQLYRGSNLLTLFFSLFKIDALLKLWRQEGLRGLYKVRDSYDSLNWVTCKQAQCGRQFTTKQSQSETCILDNIYWFIVSVLPTCSDYVPKSIIDKLDRLVLWIYPYVACQQGSALLPSEERNFGTL